MIRKVYIHNYKTLSNFELELDNFVLLLGDNGVGKSAVMECLVNIREYIISQEDTDRIFLPSSWPFWEGGTEHNQVFEVEVAGNGGIYRYRLAIEYDKDFIKNRMVEESLHYDGQPLFVFKDRMAHLYRDDHTPGPSFPIDWSRSGVGWLLAGDDNKKLFWFRNWLKRLYLVHISPALIGSATRHPADSLDFQCANFASWFHHLMLTNGELIVELTTTLRKIIPGLRSMQLLRPDRGEDKLTVTFSGKGVPRNGSISFDHLSDGQKCLIILYTIFEQMKFENDAVLFVDEPENFLALPEIRPWLDQLVSYSEEHSEHKQYIIISHHPDLINFLALDSGIWIYRDKTGGVSRHKPITPIFDEVKPALPISVLVKRKWFHEEA